jgi:hypothetical protein
MDALPAAASAASPPAADPPRAAPTEPPPVEPAPAAVATTAPAKEPAPSAGSPWRIEVSLGRSGGGYLSYWFQNWPSLSSTRVDVLAPFRTDHWSWTAGFEVFGESQHSSSWATSGGCVRRFALLPGWLAADASIGGGLAVSRLTFNQQTETGRLDLQTITRGPNLFGQVAGNLAFVRFQLGEIVAGVRIHEYPEFWDQPMFTLAAGLRIGIP